MRAGTSPKGARPTWTASQQLTRVALEAFPGEGIHQAHASPPGLMRAVRVGAATQLQHAIT
jgi:hypothetical protein